MSAIAPSALHPADEMAYLRGELDRLTLREIVLTRQIASDHGARVGALHHVTVSRV